MRKFVLFHIFSLSFSTVLALECDLEVTQPSFLEPHAFALKITETSMDFSEKKILRVATLNAQDLMTERPKSPNFQKQLGLQILHDFPDILFLQEVSGVDVFNKNYLKDAYMVLEFKTNDSKNKRIACLVRRDLAVTVTTYNFSGGFHRNAPVVVFRFNGCQAKTLVLIGVHLKSKKLRPQENMDALRNRDLDNLTRLIHEVKKHFTDAIVGVLGDFNGDFKRDENMIQFVRQSGLVDPMSVRGIPDLERFTHIHRFPDGSRVYQQIDGILFLPNAIPYVLDARTRQPVDLSGAQIDFANAMENNVRLPTDHKMISVDLSTQGFLPE